MLGLTGELFAVALLLLSIVPAVVTTDSATMEIKMDALCQHDMHGGLKFTGTSFGLNPANIRGGGLHPLSIICYIFSQFSVSVFSAVTSRPCEFMLLKVGLTGSFSLLASLAALQFKVKALGFVRQVPVTLCPPFPGQPTSLVPPSQA